MMDTGYPILPEIDFNPQNPFKTPMNFTNNSTYHDSLMDAFPFKLPFHPGKGLDSDYPDPPYEPVEPEDEPDD
jgi:hypothetical protein